MVCLPFVLFSVFQAYFYAHIWESERVNYQFLFLMFPRRGPGNLKQRNKMKGIIRLRTRQIEARLNLKSFLSFHLIITVTKYFGPPSSLK